MKLHQRALQRVAGELVTYTDAGITWTGVMTPGQSTFGDATGDGEVHTDVKTADWLVDRESFVTDSGDPIEPKVGGRIENAEGIVFELVPAEGNKPYTWGDSRHVRYRIHTDQISS